MKQREAIDLLEKTFRNDFNTERYSVFIKELFNVIPIKIQSKPQIAKPYREYISEVTKIGEFEDEKKKKIEILAIKLIKTSSRDRARTMQRNFIADWLGLHDYNGALVAFYGEDPEDWRFSFVKMEYGFIKDEEGKVKIAKELTPAKRYSFLVGKNEPNHTCQRQFLQMLMDEDVNPTLEKIENAFSIDNVTKEFFEEYKDLFLKLKDSLEKVIDKDERIKREFENKGISTIDFSKKLLGQIVFIYFLQKKGWLGVTKDNEWGTGHRNFLRKLFNKGIISYENFFNDILEPLFYDALANPRDGEDGYYAYFRCKIPFLNGGLFEAINDYAWEDTDILLENEIFRQILDTFDRFNFTVKEDEPLEKEVAVDPEMLGKVFENLLDVKERKDKGAFYTPREIVHYMCQQSLINYLETNTEISREDIENFILYGDLTLSHDQKIINDINIKNRKLKDGIISKTIYDKEVSELLNKFKLARSIIIKKELFDKLLKEIKIVDPAVGSGAFPVGMMNEIIKARSILSIFYPEDEQKKRTIYNMKRETIENCLYGVDIDSSAVEIAKLRFWLSLIVDEESIKDIKPLPNLDHKIMCGNSLIEEFEGLRLFDEKLLEPVEESKPHQYEIEEIEKKIESLYQEKGRIALGKEKKRTMKEVDNEITRLENKRKKLMAPKDDKAIYPTLDEAAQRKFRESQQKLYELRNLHKVLFDEQNKVNKRQIRADIERIEWELIEATLKEQNKEDAMVKLEQYKKSNVKPFFIWKLYFSEVFQRENPGFDVVIANPPYIQLQKAHIISEDLSKLHYLTYTKTGDLYCIFYERSLELTRSHGVSTLITSNSWMRTQYGELLRKYFVSHCNPIQLLNFEDAQLFESAIVETNVLIVKKEPWDKNLQGVTVKNDFIQYNFLWEYVKKKKVILSDLNSNYWSISDEKTLCLKKKIENNSTLLKNYGVNINFGVKTGYNKAFIIDSEKKKFLIHQDNKNCNLIKPLLQGRDVQKYYFTFCDKWLISTFPALNININEYPILHNYLRSFGNRLDQIGAEYIDENGSIQKTRKKTHNKWFETQDQISYHTEFEKEKIIWGELSDKPKFAYDNEGYYPEATLFFMTGKNLKYLLAILNSKLSEWYFNQISTSSGMGTNRWKKYKIELLPIKNISEENRLAIEKLVDKILLYTRENDYSIDITKQKLVNEIIKNIDKQIFQLYELTHSDIEIIMNSGGE